MRARATAVAAAALAAVLCHGGARGDDDDDDGADRAADVGQPDDSAEVLLARDAEWSVRWVESPALTAQLGPVVLGDLDFVRGRGPRVDFLGQVPPDLPPPGWPLAVTNGTRGAGPFGAGDRCDCTTKLGDLPDGRRVAALWAVTSFAVAAGASDLRVLEIRARYRDGIALWLNGVPVARRNLPGDGPALRLAERPHGPEWETFYVPVTPGLLRAGDNVIAAAVYPSGRSSAPSLELEVAGRRASRVVRGPMIQRVGATDATVVIETDLPTRAELAWGAGAALDQQVASPPGRRHVFDLTGLPATAAVHYRVTVDGVPGPIHRFATPPGRGEVIRFAVYGDVRGGHSTHAELVEAIAADAPDLILASGDLVLRGTDEADWQRFFSVTGPILATTPYYSALGNHDMGRTGDLGRRFGDIFALPSTPADRPAWGGWYSFDVADVHFVVLDSNSYDQPAQRAWLEADLDGAAKARAVFAITHDGPFSRGLHGGNRTAERDYVPILAAHRVTLLFSGHDHIYQRGRRGGLDYVVSGGGGAPLYRISCGVAGRSRCRRDDGMTEVAREHHYLLVSVFPGFVEMCPRRPDATPLEPCVRYPLRGAPDR